MASARAHIPETARNPEIHRTSPDIDEELRLDAWAPAIATHTGVVTTADGYVIGGSRGP